MRIHTDEEQALEPCLIHEAAPRQMGLVSWGKMTNPQIARAWKYLQAGLSNTEIYHRLGIPQNLLSDMRHGKRYRHITGVANEV